jgi:hypothetical protein
MPLNPMRFSVLRSFLRGSCLNVEKNVDASCMSLVFFSTTRAFVIYDYGTVRPPAERSPQKVT